MHSLDLFTGNREQDNPVAQNIQHTFGQRKLNKRRGYLTGLNRQLDELDGGIREEYGFVNTHEKIIPQ